jgi:alpha-mannosidase
MLDTLLVVGGETCRRFRIRLVLDLQHPYQGILDTVMPCLAASNEVAKPARGGRASLIEIDHAAVALTHLGIEPAEGERPERLVVDLLETSATAARVKIRLPFRPATASHVDFQGEAPYELSVEGDVVTIDLTPNELARIEIPLA